MKIKKNIVIMYAIAFLQGMVFYSAVATLYRQAVGVNVFQITIIESISLALALALELPWGIFAEKIGYKNTMILCCLIYFVSKIVFWQADGFGMFLLERVMLSFVMAGLSGVDASVLYLSCEEDYIHKAFSIYDCLGTAGMILSAGAYSLFFRGAYRMAGFATVIAYGIAAFFVLFLKEVKPAEKKEEQPIREFVVILKDTMQRKELFLFLIGIALFSECHQTITVFLNQLQYVRCGMTNRMIGGVYVAMTIAGLLGARSATFSKRFGKRKAGGFLFGISALSCLVMTITENAVLSILSIVILRVAFSLMMPLVETIENQQVTHKNRASALSINATIMDGVAIATNLAFGKASDVNLSFAFGIGAIFSIVGLLLFLYGTGKMEIRE